MSVLTCIPMCQYRLIRVGCTYDLITTALEHDSNTDPMRTLPIGTENENREDFSYSFLQFYET